MYCIPLAAAALTATLFFAIASPAQPTQRNAPGNVPPPARGASPAPVPERTTASYGDWTLRCAPRVADAAAGTPGQVCELILGTQDSRGQTIAQFALGRMNAAEPTRLVMLVPPNISIPTAPQLQPDQERPNADALSLVWRACGTGGCMADTNLTDAALTRLRNRDVAGRMVWQDTTGATVAVPFSFRGFGLALDALAAVRQ